VDAARLRRSDDIAAVRSEGIKMQHRFFALRARPNDAAVMRLAVSAPRSLGRAVKRNRARRRVREAFRVEIARLAPANAHDVVIVARPGAETAPAQALREAAQTALHALRSG
jgi:ribonuclease P protein component